MPYKKQSETENEREKVGIAFRAISVFDVSQTSGDDLPDYIHDLDGDLDPEQVTAVMDALREITSVPIEFEVIPGDTHGYYNQTEKRIAIQKGMSDVQTVKTAIHEAAHALLHDRDSELQTVQSSRGEKEVQAESVAFIVASHFGLDTSEYSFPYIAGWSDGKPLDQLNRVLAEIHDTSKTVIDAVTQALTTQEQTENEEAAESEDDDLAISGFAM